MNFAKFYSKHLQGRLLPLFHFMLDLHFNHDAFKHFKKESLFLQGFELLNVNCSRKFAFFGKLLLSGPASIYFQDLLPVTNIHQGFLFTSAYLNGY